MSGSQTNSVSCHTKCVNELFLLLVFFCVASPTTCSVRLNFCDKRLLSVRCVQIPINSCHSTAIILLIVFFCACLACAMSFLCVCVFTSLVHSLYKFLHLTEHTASFTPVVARHIHSTPHNEGVRKFFFLFSSVVQC